jgi:hypothetical protein
MKIDELTRKLQQPEISDVEYQAIYQELSGMTGRFLDPAMTAARQRQNRPL